MIQNIEIGCRVVYKDESWIFPMFRGVSGTVIGIESDVMFLMKPDLPLKGYPNGILRVARSEVVFAYDADADEEL